jgi:hypothetical protein
MEHLIAAVRKGIAERNWYASLALALALPDICGFLETPLGGSQARYISWCNRFLVPTYTSRVGASGIEHIFLHGEDCYALRCAFLHEGADEILRQRVRKALESFVFIDPPPGGRSVHCNQSNAKLQLQVDKFCEDVCGGVEAWCGAVTGDVEVESRMKELLVIHDLHTGLTF